jgi:hypothetical protein
MTPWLIPSYEMATAETAVINLSSLGPGTVRQNPFWIMVNSSELREITVNKDKLEMNRKCIETKKDSTLDY